MHKTLFVERKDKGVTQKEVAEAIGMKLSTYGRKERGEQQFDLSEAAKISRFLKIPIDILFPEFF